MKTLIPLALLAIPLVPLRAAEEISFVAESLVENSWVKAGGIDATVVTDGGKQVLELKDEDSSNTCEYRFLVPAAMIPELEERGFVMEARIKQLSYSNSIILRLRSLGQYNFGIYRDDAKGNIGVSLYAQGKDYTAQFPATDDYFTLKAVFEPGKEMVVTIDGEPGFSFPADEEIEPSQFSKIEIGNRVPEHDSHTLIESFRFGPAGAQP